MIYIAVSTSLLNTEEEDDLLGFLQQSGIEYGERTAYDLLLDDAFYGQRQMTGLRYSDRYTDSMVGDALEWLERDIFGSEGGKDKLYDRLTKLTHERLETYLALDNGGYLELLDLLTRIESGLVEPTENRGDLKYYLNANKTFNVLKRGDRYIEVMAHNSKQVLSLDIVKQILREI